MDVQDKSKSKPKRPPRVFRPKMSRRTLKRRILRRIPIRSEREWVRQLYGDSGDSATSEANGSGAAAGGKEGAATDLLERREDLTAEEIKRLRKLAKAVKHNRGFFQPVKIGLLGAVAGAIAVFFLVFATPLASRGVERGLESVFAARAELEGFTLRFREPGFAFDGLAVADRNSPMSNLFEVSGGELRLDLGQLVRGRVVVRNLEVRDISFGGERSESGELPPERQPPPVDESEQRPGAGEQISALFGDAAGELRGMISGIDAQEIVAAELAALTTPDAVSQERERIEGLIDEWQQRVEDAESAVSDFSEDVETLLAIDPSQIDSVSRLREAMETAERVTDGGRDFYERGSDGYRAATSTRDDIREALNVVSAALDEDVAYIEGRIPDPDMVLREPFAGLVASIAEEHVTPYVERARTAYDAYLRLQALRERFTADEAVADDRPTRGRDIIFPSREYPRFLLERAAVNVVDNGSEYAGSLTHVSSNPDLTGQPSRARYTWSYEMDTGERAGDAAAADAAGSADMTLVSDETPDQGRNRRGGDVQVDLDLRSGADARVEILMDLFGQRMNLPIGSPGVIPIDELRSELDFEARLAVSPEGSVRFRGDGSLFEPSFGFSADNEITRRTQAVLDRTGTVTAGVTLPPGDDQLVRTNLDDALAAELEAFIRDLRDRAIDEAERYVRDQFSSEIAQVEEFVAQGTSVVGQAQARYDELVELYEQAEREKARIRQRLADLEEEVERRAQEEIERAERRAREEAERAGSEARDEVEGRVRDRLDGFMGR